MDHFLTLFEKYEPQILAWGIKICIALAIFIIGRIIAKVLARLCQRMMLRKLTADAALAHFVGTIISVTITILAVLMALQQLDAPMASLLAVLGAAGLAVGLALQDSLKNFASGVMLMVNRPFRADDFIEAAGTSGVVERVGIFQTTIRTVQNQEVTIPNGSIVSGNIVNYSIRSTRRLDFVVGISYESDIAQAKELIRNILQADERLHQEPAPEIQLDALADSSVNIVIRVWTNTDVFWAARSDLIENIKTGMDKAGISIPYPHRVQVPYQADTHANR